jgi:hypothetical protein
LRHEGGGRLEAARREWRAGRKEERDGEALKAEEGVAGPAGEVKAGRR